MEKSKSFFLTLSLHFFRLALDLFCSLLLLLLLFTLLAWLFVFIARVRLPSICDALFLCWAEKIKGKKRCEWTKLLARLLFSAPMTMMMNDDDRNSDSRQHMLIQCRRMQARMWMRRLCVRLCPLRAFGPENKNEMNARRSHASIQVHAWIIAQNTNQHKGEATKRERRERGKTSNAEKRVFNSLMLIETHLFGESPISFQPCLWFYFHLKWIFLSPLRTDKNPFRALGVAYMSRNIHKPSRKPFANAK